MLWRPGPSGVEVALVHRPRYDDWTLPKGKTHAGEPVPAAARREVVEETGYDAALGRWLGRTQYRLDEHGESPEKRVDYWAARAGAATGPVADEVDAVRWLPFDEAAARLTWVADREVLVRFTSRPPRTSTVLLVRHAWAGRSETWAGPDEERPLDAVGVVQAASLAATLPAFWLAAERPAVLSAPPLRCVDTVAWAGDVTVDARLGEEAYRAGPAAAVAAVREAAESGVAVVCGQGGVIPAVVESLRRADGLAPAGVRAPKGSVWVLSFAAGRLVQADYLDPA